jgi:hypothetical protein
MELTHETEKFWTFTCPCGCVKAFSKPSVKAQAIYERERAAAERIRSDQDREHKAYSFGSK